MKKKWIILLNYLYRQGVAVTKKTCEFWFFFFLIEKINKLDILQALFHRIPSNLIVSGWLKSSHSNRSRSLLSLIFPLWSLHFGVWNYSKTIYQTKAFIWNDSRLSKTSNDSNHQFPFTISIYYFLFIVHTRRNMTIMNKNDPWYLWMIGKSAKKLSWWIFCWMY